MVSSLRELIKDKIAKNRKHTISNRWLIGDPLDGSVGSAPQPTPINGQKIVAAAYLYSIIHGVHYPNEPVMLSIRPENYEELLRQGIHREYMYDAFHIKDSKNVPRYHNIEFNVEYTEENFTPYIYSKMGGPVVHIEV